MNLPRPSQKNRLVRLYGKFVEHIVPYVKHDEQGAGLSDFKWKCAVFDFFNKLAKSRGDKVETNWRVMREIDKRYYRRYKKDHGCCPGEYLVDFCAWKKNHRSKTNIQA